MKRLALILFFLSFIGGMAAYVRKPAVRMAGTVAGIFIAPTPTPTIALPSTLAIPKLGISVPVEQVGKDAAGLMDVPKVATHTAWYNLGPKPGETGNAVIDGHVDTPDGKPSVFADLHTLISGDDISVTDQAGITHRYRVTDVVSYDTDNFPVPEVFGPYASPRLNLITCGGTWNPSEKTYAERLVVFSEKI